MKPLAYKKNEMALTQLVMTPLEFLQRLAALVPRPRLHLWRARPQRGVAVPDRARRGRPGAEHRQ